MINKKHAAVLAAAMASAVAFCGTDNASKPLLTIGDRAPSISSAAWLKGGSPGPFKKGQVYVVEFWATWCGPCKDNIPHLTELAKKYKDKASIIGISIWENLDKNEPDPLKKVQTFVDSQGDKMVYFVGADKPSGSIANDWMKAAHEGAIPCSFIVDQTGTIAWIGHPARMEEALVKVIDGSFDVKAAKQARDFEHQYSKPIDEALEKKNYRALLKAVDKALAAQPDREPVYAYNRFVALFHVSLPEGKKYAEKILKESSEAPGAYHMIASVFASYGDLTKEAYQFGLTVAAKGAEKSPENIMLNAIQAQIYFHLKDKKNAITCIKTAIEKAQNEPRTTQQFRDMLNKSLHAYEAMKG